MQAQEWDWSRTVVDHLDLHTSDFSESVRFYETILAPLGIPKLYERDGAACFTHLNVVAQTPPTKELHLCFYARSKEEVDAFHRLGVEAGFRSNGAPGLPRLASRGLSVPDDISVVGYDDIPVASFVDPPLTTVHQPMREVGALAAKLLLDRISGDATAPVGGRIHLPTMVVERGSVGPPRNDR